MYPKVQDVDKTSCLESLIGIRSACAPGTKKDFFLEDLEGVDVKTLASLARASSFKGSEFGEFLISSAAREMMGDIELLMNEGYSVKPMVGDTCSNCDLLPLYTANTGIQIQIVAPSSYSLMRISRLTVLVNVSGDYQFVIDDGVSPVFFTPTLQAGVKMPINIDYVTSEKKVKIYFTNPAVGLGQVQCATKSSCGCGGGQTANLPIVVNGLNGGNTSVNQFGFLPCVTISCSTDALVCNMIKSTPRIFGLALLYKVGEKISVERGRSTRNNEEASYGTSDEVLKQYGQLYWAKMKGAADNIKGVRHIISSYLSEKQADICIECKNRLVASYATG